MYEYCLATIPSVLVSLIIYDNKDFLIDLVHEHIYHHKFFSADNKETLKKLLTHLSDFIWFFYNSITDLLGKMYKGISSHYNNSGSILEFFNPMPIFSFFGKIGSGIELSVHHPIDSPEGNNVNQRHHNIEFTIKMPPHL